MTVGRRQGSPYWYIQFQLHGHTYIRSSRTIDKKLAERMETDWRAKLHAQQFMGRKDRITLRDALEAFIATKVGTPNHRQLRSHFKSIVSAIPMGKPLDEISLHDLERLKRDRESMGVGPQTIRHDLNLIRGGWKHARKLGFQTSDLVFPSLKIPKYSLRYLTAEEESRLLAALNPNRCGNGLKRLAVRNDEMRRNLQDAFDLVVLLLDTGARYSEIANIEWHRVDLTRKEIHLWRSKVQNETILFMTDRAFDILQRRSLTKKSGWVFASRNGGPRGYASQSIRKALRNAGLADCRIHTLRHTHASRLVQNGMSVYEVREILGHSDIKTTMRYAHLESRQVTSKAKDVINRLNAALPNPAQDSD